MFLDSFFRYLDSHGPRTRARHRAVRPVPSRLLLERLEDRALPSFLAPLSFDVGAYPKSVAVGDFNRDGRPDLATADQNGNNSVSVLLGNGNGSFQPARQFAARSYPVSVAVGDFGRVSAALPAVPQGQGRHALDGRRRKVGAPRRPFSHKDLRTWQRC